MIIVLIDPPKDDDGYNDNVFIEGCIYPPLWAISLANYLERKNLKAEIHILDGQILDLSETISFLEENKPDLVGIGPMLVNYGNALSLALKSKMLGSKVVMGGHHATGLAEEIMLNRGICSDNYCVDAVIQEDGERSFYEYAIGKPLSKIKNLVFQDRKDGSIKKNIIEHVDLNSLPNFGREIIDYKKYYKIFDQKWPDRFYKNVFHIYSKKGCGWRTNSKGGCIFCSRMYKSLRARSPHLVLEEIDSLVKKFNADLIWDISDDFFDQKGWFKEFHSLYKGYSFKPRMRVYARADDINSENIKKIKDLNIHQVVLGLESGDPKILSSMKKGTVTSIGFKAVKDLKKAGISVIGNFVFGGPGESKDSIDRTVDFVHKLNALGMNVVLSHIFEPLPNSLSFQLLVKKMEKKYKYKDSFDRQEMINDWVHLFCQTSLSEILIALKKLENLPNHPKLEKDFN